MDITSIINIHVLVFISLKNREQTKSKLHDKKINGASAYIVAKQNGKGEDFKQAVFKAKFEAKFEEGADISNKNILLKIYRKFNLYTQVATVINNAESKELRKFAEYNNLKKQNKIYATPTLIINDGFGEYISSLR